MQALILWFKPPSFLLVCLLLAAALTPSLALSAESIAVNNVRFEVSGNKIVITYDLIGSPDETYMIKVTLRRKQVPSYAYVPKSVTGDVDEGKYNGTGRQIHWDILRDHPDGLEGDDYYFRIEATMIPKRSNLLYYLGGGAVVAGTAAYLLFFNKTGVPEQQWTFPQPIGRPTEK
jgi:hypothetical protein